MRTFLGFIPRPVRFSAFALVVGVILWLSLAPQEEIPGSTLIWDKASHAGAYAILTLAGLLLSTHRRLVVVLAIWALVVGIEVMQSLMDLGRQGDWRDALANTVGIVAGVGLWALARRFKPKPPP
jgi:VanZ family protein